MIPLTPVFKLINHLLQLILESRNGPLKFLVDTGANTSFISPRHTNLGKLSKLSNPTNVKNVKGRFQIDHFIELNPFQCIQGTHNLAFLVFEFHDFFDGLIGYESLSQLNASICTNTNSLILPFARIAMEKKFPDTFKFHVNAHETKVIELPTCQQEGEFLVTKDIVVDNKAFIHTGLYKAENFRTKLLLTNFTNESTEVEIRKGDIEANNFETGSPPNSNQENTLPAMLQGQLRLNHLNQEESSSLIDRDRCECVSKNFCLFVAKSLWNSTAINLKIVHSWKRICCCIYRR